MRGTQHGKVSRDAGETAGERGLLTREDWDELYCEIIDRTGWTWDYVGRRLTLRKAFALMKHLRANPSLQYMIGRTLGYDMGVKSAPASLEEIAEFIPVNKLSAEEFNRSIDAHPCAALMAHLKT